MPVLRKASTSCPRNARSEMSVVIGKSPVKAGYSYRAAMAFGSRRLRKSQLFADGAFVFASIYLIGRRFGKINRNYGD
jgi:hypothetical protein